ncbi:DUF1501 domain-containing protein [Reichenbachiella ulvae]|uniref:DUF1501 domain-containing protein n=1 Tax=Reichenbachiella ulvae TaxID=2980104 RepID=A0ABT3CRX4_9BACT|nr:DUF1501 domain-containing protein [Reichenbachiella ulvae]MCV9386303.1 DUF1501 domain-containing protein [Reichenbachiella ulvae]
MKRREFLRHACHTMAVPGLMSTIGLNQVNGQSLQRFLQLAAETDRVLVMIFLEGGNDGLNTVVPLNHLSELNSVRPHVILPDNSLHELAGAEVGLHPALDGLASLYKENRLQIIQSVGYENQNYSHFRSTDIWMSGSDSTEVIPSGWSGRFLDQTFPGYPEVYPTDTMKDPLSVEIGFGSSLLFQGPNASMSMTMSNPESFYNLIENRDDPAPDTPAGDRLQYVRLIARQSQQYGEVVKSAAEKVNNQLAYPETDLANQLKIVSRLIAGGLKTPMYMVRLGGFDTHDAQVEDGDHTTGEHATLLKTLNDAIMAFMADMEHLQIADRVLGMTFSEFGRRIVSNASLGTDHGSAAPMFFFGNHLNGGVLGQNPNIHTGQTYEDNLEMQYDYRQLYASVLDQWFGADSSVLNATLYRGYDTLPIISDGVLNAPQTSGSFAEPLLFPNPVKEYATLSFSVRHNPVSVSMMSIDGRLIRKMHRGSFPLGTNRLSIDVRGLRTGQYLLVMTDGRNKQALNLIKS